MRAQWGALRVSPSFRCRAHKTLHAFFFISLVLFFERMCSAAWILALASRQPAVVCSQLAWAPHSLPAALLLHRCRGRGVWGCRKLQTSTPWKAGGRVHNVTQAHRNNYQGQYSLKFQYQSIAASLHPSIHLLDSMCIKLQKVAPAANTSKSGEDHYKDVAEKHSSGSAIPLTWPDVAKAEVERRLLL